MYMNNSQWGYMKNSQPRCTSISQSLHLYMDELKRSRYHDGIHLVSTCRGGVNNKGVEESTYMGVTVASKC